MLGTQTTYNRYKCDDRFTEVYPIFLPIPSQPRFASRFTNLNRENIWASYCQMIVAIFEVITRISSKFTSGGGGIQFALSQMLVKTGQIPCSFWRQHHIILAMTENLATASRSLSQDTVLHAWWGEEDWEWQLRSRFGICRDINLLRYRDKLCQNNVQTVS